MGKTILIAAALAVGVTTVPASAGRKPGDVSWGKPHVSFERYRQDTLECANKAYGLDVGMKPRTMEALHASNVTALYAILTSPGVVRGGPGEAQSYFAALASIEPDHVLLRTTNYEALYRNAARTDVIDQLQQVVDYCLTHRGYQRFKLTGEQKHQLHQLHRQTPERTRFLYQLGSDPQVLDAQQVEARRT